jgi:hypothetical protein
MSNEVFIKCEPFKWCAASIRLSRISQPGFEGLATLVFSTGCSTAQTYATREELLALSGALITMADELQQEKVPA